MTRNWPQTQWCVNTLISTNTNWFGSEQTLRKHDQFHKTFNSIMNSNRSQSELGGDFVWERERENRTKRLKEIDNHTERERAREITTMKLPHEITTMREMVI